VIHYALQQINQVIVKRECKSSSSNHRPSPHTLRAPMDPGLHGNRD